MGVHHDAGRSNDKGKVEGLVKYARANFMTPVPIAASFDGLNAMLLERCRTRQRDRAGRHAETIGERLVADLAHLRDLPAAPPACRMARAAPSTALVRYRGNDYSTPTAYGYQDVMVKGSRRSSFCAAGARSPGIHDPMAGACSCTTRCIIWR